MAKQLKTPLQIKYQALPKSVEFKKDILPQLEAAGINERTFQRDKITDPNNIPSGRLLVYARLFECEIADLMDGFVKIKVKSLVRHNTLSKRSGLKTAIIAFALLVLTSCSAHYCPSYSGHAYNKSGGKKANTSVTANRKR